MGREGLPGVRTEGDTGSADEDTPRPLGHQDSVQSEAMARVLWMSFRGEEKRR